ncbi:MAG: hypothetical protein U0841_15160 [Chloroflexia bacterium]
MKPSVRSAMCAIGAIECWIVALAQFRACQDAAANSRFFDAR